MMFTSAAPVPEVEKRSHVVLGDFSPDAKPTSPKELPATPVSQVSTAPDSPSRVSGPHRTPSESEESDNDGHGVASRNIFTSLGDSAWPEETCAGHVFTADGLALNRDGSAAFFDFRRDGSSSNIVKHKAIDNMRALRDAQAQAAREIECSIDAVGVLHGKAFVEPASPLTSASAVKRAKLLHQMRVRGRESEGCTFCVGPEGRVCRHLVLAGPSTSLGLTRRERAELRIAAVRRRQLLASFCHGAGAPPGVDLAGTVHWPDVGPVIDVQGRRAVWDLTADEVEMYAAV